MKTSYFLRAAAMTTLLLATSTAHASSFEDALSAAYQNNPQLLAQRQRLAAVDEGVAQAVSGFRPTISGNFNANSQRTSFAGAADVNNTATTKQLQVTQPLFRGGATWASYQSALARVKAGQYELSSVEQQVMLDAVRSYMAVVTSSALLDLSRKNMVVLEEQLNAANTRFQVGEVTRTDVAQSEARLSDAKARTISAEGQLRSAMASYERVVGMPPEGTLTVPEKLPELPLTLEDALERARAANPQVQAALSVAKSSDYDVRTSQAALLPRVNLVGALSRQTGSGQNGNSDLEQDRVGVEVAVPLYQSGAEYSRVREASATARQRSHESIDRRMSVDEAVTQSWQQLESAKANITTRGEQIKAATLALEGVKQEQQYGSRTVIDVLNAEQELFSARTNLVSAQGDRIVAAYSLAFALGQLSPANLGLNVAAYNPQKHADEVGWKTLGF